MLCPRRDIKPHVLRGLKVGALCSVLLWTLIVLFSLNFSSLGMWDRFLPQVDKDHVLIGQPRGIRSDEWLANSPIMLAYAGRIGSASEGVMDFAGPPGAELLMNQPAPHFSTLFRPQFWGFFLFERDRGFSFLYGTKLVSLGFVFFSIAFLLCESSVIALCATLWLCFSSFFQWWFSICLPELVASGLLAALSAWAILYVRSMVVALASSIVLVVSLIDFTMCFYPPFMVPIAHGALAIGVTLVLKYGVVEGRALAARGVLLLGAFSVFGGLMYRIYQDIASVIQIVQNTDYPGQRVSVPGTIPGYRYLNNLADLYFTDVRFPAWLGNVCEAAGFIVLWPLVIPIVAFRWVRRQISGREAILFVPLLLVLMGHVAWMSFSLPQWVGDISGLFLAAGQRVYVGQGVFGVLILSMVTALLPRRVVSSSSGAWFWGVIVVVALVVGWSIERSMPSFLSKSELTLLALATATAITGLIGSVPLMFWIPILWLVSPNIFVNPIVRGIKPITERKLVSFATTIGRGDPNGRWVVFGEGGYANLLKVGGVRVFNGVVYAPRMDDYREFDPKGIYRNVYNRYAHVGVEANGTTNDPAIFQVVQGDSFVMKVHPCNSGFERVGVNYFVFTYEPTPQQVECLKPIGKGRVGPPFQVYKRKTELLHNERLGSIDE